MSLTSRLTRHALVLASTSALLAFAACSSTSSSSGPSDSPSAAAGATGQAGSGNAAAGCGGSSACCADGQYVDSTGVCAPLEGIAITHQFGDETIAAGGELLGLCRSWTLDNDDDLLVNSVHFVQSEASHHSNFVFVPESVFDGPDGFWECSDRNYDFYSAINAGGVLYAQSTQATDEVQKFPDGAAIRIPAHSRVISDVHLLNATSDSITGHATISLYTLTPAQLQTELTSFHVEYDDLHLAAHATTRVTGTCPVASDVSAVSGAPFAPKLFYVLPHTHTHGKRVFLEVLGGPNDGQSLFDVGAYNGEARGKAFNPPADLTGADGFTYGCEFQNDTDAELQWGFGAGEMCEIFGFIEASPFFQAAVTAGVAAGTDNGTTLFAGPCGVTVDAPH